MSRAKNLVSGPRMRMVALLAAAPAVLSLSACGTMTELAGDAGSDLQEIDRDREVEPGGPCPPGMAFVPAGDFVMGQDGPEGDPDTRPEHVVTLSAYCIDIFQVTNAQWHECVSAGACDPPWRNNGLAVEDYYGNPEYGNYPVISYIDWHDARAFCRWMGKRLPTEAEWEKAGRGGCEMWGNPDECDAEDVRTYAWGNEPPTSDLVNFCPECCAYPCEDPECGQCVHTIEVGTKPLGASPYGLLDMHGNACEWVWDVYEEDYYSTGGPSWVDPLGPPADGTDVRRVYKGGHPSQPYYPLAHRQGYPHDMGGNSIGLRCASDPVE